MGGAALVEVELTPEERLYRDIVRYTDPNTYDGASPRWCLIGQTMAGLGLDYMAPIQLLAARYGVSAVVLGQIDLRAAHSPYRHDLPAALAMAREVLGIQEAE